MTRFGTRLRVVVLALICTTASVAIAPLSAAPAFAAPSFHLPFDCNTSWTATTYDRGENLNTGASWSHQHYLDFGQGGASGKAVRASAGGFARLTSGTEGKVTIDHGGGWTTVYQHMYNVNVSSGGRQVNAGDQIGTVGNAGQNTTGAHLHYAQLSNGAPQNPSFSSGSYSWSPGRTYTAGGYRFVNDRYSTNALASASCGGGGSSGSIVEGGLVRVSDGPHTGKVLRVVGGHLMHLETCEPFAGCAGFSSISGAQYDAHVASHPQVANGTFVRVVNGAKTGWVARAIGGALLHLNTCEPFNGCAGVVEVTEHAYDSYTNARPTIANGTFVRIVDGVKQGWVSRVVGGTLLHFTTCEPFGGCAGMVEVPEWTYDAYDASHRTIADGTFVRVVDGSKQGWVSRAVGGALLHLNTCDPVGQCGGMVEVPEATYDAYAGAHPVIANGAFVRVVDGTKQGWVSRAAGGALLHLNSCEPFNGCAGMVEVPEGAYNEYSDGHARVADGTSLTFMPSGRTVVVNAGACRDTTDNSAAVGINDGVFQCATAPSRLGAPRLRLNGRRVTATWQAATANGSPVNAYLVSIDGRARTLAAARRSITVTLGHGRHTFRVASRNAAGTSPMGAPATVRVR